MEYVKWRNCSNCVEDCGICPPVCGNGIKECGEQSDLNGLIWSSMHTCL
jgi:hypothetical protein